MECVFGQDQVAKYARHRSAAEMPGRARPASSASNDGDAAWGVAGVAEKLRTTHRIGTWPGTGPDVRARSIYPSRNASAASASSGDTQML